jgi:hypothetical protein
VASWALTDALSVASSRSTTEAAPSGLDGLALAGVGGFDLVVECEEGQTFTGATPGALLGYRGYPRGAAIDWAPAGDLDVTIPAAAAGQRRWALTGWTVANPRGRIAHIASGVQVTGGALTVRYECTTLRGHRT